MGHFKALFSRATEHFLSLIRFRRARNPVLEAWLAEREKERSARIEAFEKERTSAPYQAEARDTKRICSDFIRTLTACWTYSTRIPNYTDRSLVFRNVDALLESAVCIQMQVEQGARMPARRELRFLLELAVKTLFANQSMPRSNFADRLVFFERKISPSGITPEVNKLALDLIPEAGRQKLVADMIRAWGHAGQYVHPSIKQLEERVALAEQGITIGFDNAAELAAMNAELFEVFGLTLVLVLHDLGPMCGDLFEGLFSEWPEWIFHSHRSITAIDEQFDYKAERQERLEALKKFRQERLRARPGRATKDSS